ncbi:MAG: hypothetical protein ABF899_05925 [Oenococcus sp.]|uniref:hypothetical protein n=1 Tax=Oenococcus sp. TaxID=1979414 RepID=UPI0039EC2A86
MTKQLNLHLVAENKIPLLNNLINNKIDYLTSIKQAISESDYLSIYELLDSARFNEKIRHWQHADPNYFLSNMTETIQPELAEFLVPKLLAYLQIYFPFFFFREVKTGVYEILFGRWPSARTFGILDVIRIEFIFNDPVINELRDFMDDPSFVQNRDDQLKELHRANRIYAGKPGIVSEQSMQENQTEILRLQKTQAVLELEQEQIEKHFGSFSHFLEQAGHLYVDYLNFLNKEN